VSLSTLVFALAYFGLQLHQIDADTPTNLGAVRLDGGAFFDEGYKTLEARNLVLFGKTKWAAADEYSGWSSNPFTIWSNYWTFRLFGLSLRNARLLSLCFAAGATVLMWLLLRRRFGRLHAHWGLTVFLLHPLFILYSRQAILEIKILFFGMLALYFLVSRRHSLPVRTMCACAGFFLAFLCKDTIVPWVGSILAAAVTLHLSQAVTSTRTKRAVAAGVAVLAATSWVWYALHGGEFFFQGRPLASPAGIVKGLLAIEIFHMNPMVALLALIGCIYLTYAVLSNRPFRRSDLMMVFWLLIPLVAFTLFDYRPTRYYMLCLPAMIWLTIYALVNLGAILRALPLRPAGVMGTVLVLVGAIGLLSCGMRVIQTFPMGIDPEITSIVAVSRYGLPPIFLCSAAVVVIMARLRRHSSFSKRATNLGMVLLTAFCLLNVYELARWVRSPKYELQRAFRTVGSLGPDAVLVGEWAPQFSVDTGVKTIYSCMKLGGWNVYNLNLIRPTHLLILESSSDEQRFKVLVDKLYPGARSSKPIRQFEYAGQPVSIYRFSFPPQ